MKLKISALLLAAASCFTSQAQELRSAYFMQTSNTKHEINPALLEDSYLTMPLLPLGYFNFGTTGNIGAANFIYKLKPGMQGYGKGNELTTFMNPDVDRNEFLSNLRDRNTMGLYLKYQLFGMGFKAFHGVNSIELNLRSNTNICLPKDLFSFMKDTGCQEEYDISNIGVLSQNYVELGLGHAHQINDKLRVGGKVKLLFGLAYAHFKAEDFHLQMNENQWLVRGNASMSLAALGMKFDHKEGKNYIDPSTGQVTDIERIDGINTDDIKPELGGFGMAFDLGATYQVLPELKVSASITDLGFINWKNTLRGSSKGEWTFDGFKNDIYVDGTDTGHNKIEDQLDDISDDLENLFSVYDDGTGSSTKALAATLNLGAEYTLPMYDKLRFGFLYTSRIQGRYSWHQGMLSANVRPIKPIEVSLNVAANSSGITCGTVLDLHAPHFNFFIGTDRFVGKLSKQGIPLHNLNSNVSLGMSFPL